jgi:ketosteroid isomerase-like protein
MMKRLLPSIAIMLLFSSSLLAQGEKKAPEKKAGGNVEQTLLDMERKWAAAALKSDAAVIEDLLADSWTTVSAEGKVMTRAQSLDGVKKSKLTKSELSEMKVRMVDGSTAVVTGVWTGAGTDEKGQKFDTSERWTDVFANQGGKWKAIASHNTTIKK